MARNLASRSDIGIIVAGDFPESRWADLEARLVEPVALKFVYKRGQKEPFDIPTRDLLPVEIVMIVNKGIAEGKIEFGFRERNGPPGTPLLRLGVGDM